MKYSSHWNCANCPLVMFQEEEGKKEKKSSKLLLDIIDILVGGGREKRFVFFSKCSKEFDNSIIFLCACVCISSFFFLICNKDRLNSFSLVVITVRSIDFIFDQLIEYK